MTTLPITIAVATHKPYRMPEDPMYLPLHVGAALHPDVLPEMQGDDTGTNISDKNAYYSELTGLYWLWKNVDTPYKGLVHYRRHLGSPSLAKRLRRDRFERIVSHDELLPLLEATPMPIVVAKRRSYYIETVYSHYAHTFHGEQFDLCREVLSEHHPSYVEAWDHLMRSRSAHIFNMFVMGSELLDTYCAFMFDVLFEMERRLDPATYDPFHARYLGRVSERLLDPWLMTCGYKPRELPVVSPEPVDWFNKGKGFLLAKFAGKKYEQSF